MGGLAWRCNSGCPQWDAFGQALSKRRVAGRRALAGPGGGGLGWVVESLDGTGVVFEHLVYSQANVWPGGLVVFGIVGGYGGNRFSASNLFVLDPPKPALRLFVRKINLFAVDL